MNPALPEKTVERAAAAAERMPLIDALKGVAAQLILVHHLVSYGPLAEAAHRLLPALSAWLYDYGRMAVQVFLVVAGFLAARALAPDGAPLAVRPLSLLWRRYARLAPPFLASILLAVAAAAVARGSVAGDMVPEAPTLMQLLAYVFFLHSLLGVPSLSTGVWYVPVDLQLYAILVGLFWLCGRAGERRRRGVASGLVALLALASLFLFNLDAGLDNWGVYFFYAYALGVFAWWLSNRERSPWWLLPLAIVVVIALLTDFRLRVALALAVALLLALARRQGWLQRWPDSALLGYLGRISFSVFLVHFPVFMLISAVYARLAPAGDAAAVLALLGAWGSAILAGVLFFRYVESRQRWLPAGLVAGLRTAFSAGRR
ncbi:MAG: acyltransferase [Rhodocyclales bacterium]|nr:acyltransferase [Rhodocyclales bacterium]